MPTPQTIPVPMPRDKRVLHLAKSLALSNRTAWAMTGECWHWLLDEAHGERVEDTDVAMLDSVVSHEGFGRAMLEAGLVGTVDNSLVLPQELARRAAQDRDSTECENPSPAKKAQRRERNRRYREKKKASPNTNDTAKKVSAKQATLGQVAGCTVKVLINRCGQPFYKAFPASPELTGSVTDAENPNLFDALLSLAEKRKRQAEGQPGVQMAPSAEELALEAERLACYPETDEGGVLQDGKTSCETVRRLARRSETPGSVSRADSVERKSLTPQDLRDSTERLTCVSPSVSRPSSSNNDFLERNEKKPTTSNATPAQLALLNQILQRSESTKRTPVIKTAEDIAKEERVQRIAEALDISPGSVRAQEKGNLTDVVRRLRERGRDRDGLPVDLTDVGESPGVIAPPEPIEPVIVQDVAVAAREQVKASATIPPESFEDIEQRRSELIRQLEEDWLAEK